MEPQLPAPQPEPQLEQQLAAEPSTPLGHASEAPEPAWADAAAAKMRARLAEMLSDFETRLPEVRQHRENMAAALYLSSGDRLVLQVLTEEIGTSAETVQLLAAECAKERTAEMTKEGQLLYYRAHLDWDNLNRFGALARVAASHPRAAPP